MHVAGIDMSGVYWVNRYPGIYFLTMHVHGLTFVLQTACSNFS